MAFSSGNHAQGVAAAATLLGIPALIVMPKDAPAPKLEGTRSYGADVVFYDRVADDREAIARAICEERGATLIRPYDDAGVVAGQGTVGLEIANEAARRGVTLDAVLAPCSGGGTGQRDRAGVLGLKPCDTGRQRRAPKLRRHAPVACRGGPYYRAGRCGIHRHALMAPIPGEIPFALAKCHLAEALTVGDEDLAAAVVLAGARSSCSSNRAERRVLRR